METKPSRFMSFFNAITFTRNLVLNILFILVLVFIASFLAFKGEKTLLIEPHSTLVMDLEGAIVERYTQNTLDRVTGNLMGQPVQYETRFYDIVTALKAAQTDKRIDKVYLRLRNPQVGVAQAREIAQAIEDVKKAGKQVIAFSESYDQKQYLMVSSASTIYLDPEGSILMEGFGGYRQYFREALEDKLGVSVHLFRVGEYKSAAEPFIRDNASDESKKADLYWMSDLWDRLLEDVARRRDIPLSVLKDNINNMKEEVVASSGDLGLMAVKQHLVDGLMTEEMVERVINGAQVANLSLTVETPEVSLYDYVNELSFKKHGSQQIAVVVAQGEIVDRAGTAEEMDGELLPEQIRSIRENPNIKALVLRVDSPGGAVFASEKIRREVELFKKTGRPVVVSMGNTAASGGYWISMDADTIVADSSTITGSIGIFGLVPDFSKTMEKIGVSTDGVGTTPMAGAFTLGRPLGEDVSTIMQSVIDNGYVKFISKVAKARHMSIADTNEVARGRVWSGKQALDRRLVDKLGGLQVAIDEAKSLAKLKNPSVTFVEPTLSPLGSLLASWGSQASFVKASQQSPWIMALFKMASENESARLLQKTLKEPATLSSSKIYAHCLCGLP